MALQIEPTAIEGVLVLTPSRHADARGVLWETYGARAFAAAGIACAFVQDNQSLSRRAGTVRGLHYQSPPFAQAKLVRVAQGAIYDVALDIRRASPTFGRFVGVELGAADGRQVFIPEGFAHGFCTVEDATVVLYKVSAPFAPDHERGILWSDPALAIPWPVRADAAILSDKDRRHPVLADIEA
jgi:dTDP-4-dehydrorhamnose 3,5-epimerase